MAVLTSAGITFGDATTQSTAAVTPSTAFDGVGSYTVAYYAQSSPTALNGRSSFLGNGATFAGSSLRVNGRATSNTIVVSASEAGGNDGPLGDVSRVTTNAFDTANSISLSGTWRVMAPGAWVRVVDNCGTTSYLWHPLLWVRIS